MPAAGLSRAERTQIREGLEVDRERTSARLSHLTGDFDGIVEASEMVALDDEHDPEGSTIAFERAQVTSLLRQAQEHLGQIELAFERLQSGSYGGCECCSEPIAPARLLAQPIARTCVRCAAAGAQVPLPQP